MGVWTWVGAILLAAVVLYLAGILSTPIGIIVWTVVFVFILRGPVAALERHGVNRVLGTAIAYVLMFACLAALALLITSPAIGLSSQFGDLLTNLPSYIDSGVAWANELYMRYSDVLQNDEVRQWISSATSSLAEWAQAFASQSAAGVVAMGTSLANTLTAIGFGLIVAFWMLVDLRKLGGEFMRVIGEKHAEDAEMFHLTFTRVMGGYLKATVIQCFVIGVGCGILYVIIGVPSPAAIAAITGLLNIIPIVGPWLGGALAFLVCVFDNWITAVIALAGAIIVQQAVYMFVSPRIMGDSVDIHPALMFIAIMAGSAIGTAMGGMTGALVGALLSIPAVAVMKSLFVYYFEKTTGRRIVDPEGVFFKGAISEDGEVAFDPIADAMAKAPMPVATMPGSGLLKESGAEDTESADRSEKR
ncbi:MAG: AI-2E family transporter [Eggerthellaceae bacterium]|nr:AI-2E family transporter [Eggerthellaceae bacterium]